jgi:hypothetical protein
MTNYDLMILLKTGLVKEVDNFLYTDFKNNYKIFKKDPKMAERMLFPNF